MQTINLPKSVFAERPTETVSEKYNFVSSKNIMDRFLENGFEVHRAGGVKSKVNAEHSKHFVSFSNPSVPRLVDPRTNTNVGIPEVLVTNSSDGKSAVSFSLGVYTLVCSNGLVIGTEYAAKRFKHMNLTEFDVDRVIGEFINAPALLQQDINRFASRTLTEEEIRSLAIQASILKYGAIKGTTESFLNRRRAEDNGNDAWTIYNVIQENLTKGGYKLQQRSVRRMVAHRANALTQKLWDLFSSSLSV